VGKSVANHKLYLPLLLLLKPVQTRPSPAKVLTKRSANFPYHARTSLASQAVGSVHNGMFDTTTSSEVPLNSQLYPKLPFPDVWKVPPAYNNDSNNTDKASERECQQNKKERKKTKSVSFFPTTEIRKSFFLV